MEEGRTCSKDELHSVQGFPGGAGSRLATCQCRRLKEMPKDSTGVKKDLEREVTAHLQVLPLLETSRQRSLSKASSHGVPELDL